MPFHFGSIRSSGAFEASAPAAAMSYRKLKPIAPMATQAPSGSLKPSADRRGRGDQDARRAVPGRPALADGGKLVIYAGADTPTQQDGIKAAFLKRFPDIGLKLIVDYSKYHDVRVDNQSVGFSEGVRTSAG